MYLSAQSAETKVYPVLRITETLAEHLLPLRVQVGAVYPNPATAEATIAVTVPEAEATTLISFTLTDATGRIVRRGRRRLAPGHHTLSWECRDDCHRHLPAGLYFYAGRTPPGVTRPAR